MATRLTFSAILAFVVAVLMPYTASAADISAAADVVTARVAAEQQLVLLGIDPGVAVFQVGARNYAGADCPGSGWNCTTASVVVQVGSAPSSWNVSNCAPSNVGTPPDCEIIQLAPSQPGVTNTAWCSQQTSSDNPAVQRCTITQTNASGINRAFVSQSIFQSQGLANTCGVLSCQRQDARQFAKVHQINVSGNNESGVAQTISQKQSASVGLSGTRYQKQEAHQKTQVCQGGLGNPCNSATSGRNLSGIAQTNLQNLSVGFANGSTAGITQEQNMEPLEGPTSIAVVRQNSVGNNNDSGLIDFTREVATVYKIGDRDDDDYAAHLALFTGPVVQRQGIPNVKCQAAGLCGDITQSSAGVERAYQRFDETQRLVAPLAAQQFQYGPEFCCTTQNGGNLNNVDTVILVKNQSHTSSSTNGSFTDGYLQGHCESLPSGQCTVDLTLTTNGTPRHPVPNPCTGSSCAIAFTCNNSEGTNCATIPDAPPPSCLDVDVCPPSD